jgi:hypothetical protein
MGKNRATGSRANPRLESSSGYAANGQTEDLGLSTLDANCFTRPGNCICLQWVVASVQTGG